MKNIFKSNVFMLLMGFTLMIIVSGCSVKHEMKQGVKKDLTVLNLGVKREDLIKEIGNPIDAIINNEGNKKDTFVFIQGYSDTLTTARVTGHVLLSLSTFGLYELMAAEPKEGTVGTNVIILVNYDENDLVSKLKVVEGKSVIKEANLTN